MRRQQWQYLFIYLCIYLFLLLSDYATMSWLWLESGSCFGQFSADCLSGGECQQSVTLLIHWYINIQMCLSRTCLLIMICPCIKIRTILFLWYLLWYFKEVITMVRLNKRFCKWLDEFLSSLKFKVTLKLLQFNWLIADVFWIPNRYVYFSCYTSLKIHLLQDDKLLGPL